MARSANPPSPARAAATLDSSPWRVPPPPPVPVSTVSAAVGSFTSVAECMPVAACRSDETEPKLAALLAASVMAVMVSLMVLVAEEPAEEAVAVG